MAVSRLLLLLLFLIASTACDSHTTDFFCNEVERDKLRTQAENLLKDMNECSDLTPVTSRIQLPDSKMQKGTWQKTPFQDRMAEVLQSLRNLVKDVESTRMPSVCGTSLLKMLAHNARNYLRILTHPNVTVAVKRCFPRETTTPLQNSKRPSEKFSFDLLDILPRFNMLLKGKLDSLRKELEVHCPLSAQQSGNN